MASYTELQASSRLSRYVECYWFREDSRGTPDHWVLPDGCVDILFSARRGVALELSIVGLMTSRKPVQVLPDQFFFGVRFRPGMAAAFIPEAAQLTDRIEPFENIMGAAGRHLLERLADSATPDERVGVFDGFLRPLEPGDRPGPFHTRVPGVHRLHSWPIFTILARPTCIKSLSMSESKPEKQIDYIEFPATDIARTKAFYQTVFGWKFEDYGPAYTSFFDGRLGGGFTTDRAAPAQHLLVVIYARDLVALQRSIEAAGGKISKETFSFPGGRRFHFLDPSGNELAAWSDVENG
jgi:predicted enzyme related to lactoylglutathione lyase